MLFIDFLNKIKHFAYRHNMNDIFNFCEKLCNINYFVFFFCENVQSLDKYDGGAIAFVINKRLIVLRLFVLGSNLLTWMGEKQVFSMVPSYEYNLSLFPSLLEHLWAFITLDVWIYIHIHQSALQLWFTSIWRKKTLIKSVENRLSFKVESSEWDKFNDAKIDQIFFLIANYHRIINIKSMNKRVSDNNHKRNVWRIERKIGNQFRNERWLLFIMNKCLWNEYSGRLSR